MSEKKKIECNCHLMDDDLKEEGWTCYNCYEADAE
jgi:ferredoxin-thioredoxin reductase catalytic subunit